MALTAKKGTLTLSTSDSGAVVVTGVGFQPDAILFFSSRTTTTGSYVVDGDLMFGAATGLNDQWCDAASMDHGGARSVAASLLSHISCISGLANGEPTVDYEYYLDTFDSDGFTLQTVTAPSSNLEVHYLAIGGLDAARAHYVTLSTGTAPYTLDETTVGFQPDAVIFARGSGNTQADARFGIGVATAADEAGAFQIGSQDDTAAVQSLVWNSDVAPLISLLPASASADFKAELDSFLTDGFRLNVTDSPSAERYPHYLALKGGSWKAGVTDEGTASGAQDIPTTGFDPVGVFLFGNQTTSILGSPSAALDACFTIGAGDGTDEGTVWTGEDDANASGVAKKRHDEARVLWHATPATTTGGSPTTVNEADLTLGSEEFTLTWTQAGSSRKFAYLAFGDAPAGGTNQDGAAALASSSSVAATATPARNGSATVSSSSSVAAAGDVLAGASYVDGAAAIASSSSVSASSSVLRDASSSVSSSSSIAASAGLELAGASAAVDSSSSITAAGDVASENAISNWNFETDTSGWDTSGPNWDFNGGSTITRDNAQAHEGSWSGRLETPGTNQAEGVGYNLGALESGSTYRFSIYVYSSAGGEDIDVKLGERSADDAFAQYTLSAGWNLCEVDWLASGGDSWVAVRTQFGAAQSITVWIDDARVGLPLELGSATLSSSSSVAASANVLRDASSSVAASSSISAASSVLRPASAAVSSASSVSASGGLELAGATATVTASSAIAASGSTSSGASASVSSSSSIAASSSVLRDASSSATASSSISASSSVLRPGSAAIAASSSVTAAGDVLGASLDGQATIAASSSVTASSSVRRDASASVSVSSSITASGSVLEAVLDGQATIASSSSVAATATPARNGSAAVSSSSSVNAAASVLYAASSSVSSSSSVSASSSVLRDASATVASSSSTDASASPIRSSSAAVSASSAVAASGSVIRGGSAELSSSSSVNASPALIVGAVATIAGVSLIRARTPEILGSALAVVAVHVFASSVAAASSHAGARPSVNLHASSSSSATPHAGTRTAARLAVEAQAATD